MQIGDAISVAFDHPANFLGHARIRRAVEQDAAGVAQQPKRPIGDHKRADEAGKRVHPEPAERTGREQPHNDQNGYGGISHDMNNGSPHSVVAVMRAMRGLVIVPFLTVIMVMMVMTLRVIMAMVVRLTMAVAVMMPAGQQPGAGDIDREAKHSNRDRLVEADGNRIEQARYGFIG